MIIDTESPEIKALIAPKENESLGRKQERFAVMIALQILNMVMKGYRVRCGDFFRDPRAHGEYGEKKGYAASKSNHKLKIAGDLLLFKGGKFLTKTEDHADFGKDWEDMGGAWGGRTANDGNHYSLWHEGRW